MDTNLFKVSPVCWAVMSDKDSEVQTFKSVDDAAMYLESVGIPDEEVDHALIDMIANGTVRANFGVMSGKFMFSDNKRLEEKFGVA